MPFTLAHILVANPNEINIDLLLNHANTFLPLIHQTPCIDKKNDAAFQQSAIGVLEKGYIIIQRGVPGPQIGGTFMLFHCVGFTIYDPDSGKLAAGHLTIETNPECLVDALNEFAQSRHIQVRIFGGVSRRDAELNADEPELYNDSMSLAKNMLQVIATYGTKSQTTVNLVSFDVGERLSFFKDPRLARRISSRIGIAVDCEKGLVCTFTENNERSPYLVQFNECAPMCTKVYQQGRITLALHQLLHPGTHIAKRFDSTSAAHRDEMIRRSHQGVVLYIIKLLKSAKFPGVDSPDYQPAINYFLSSQFNKLFTQDFTCMDYLLNCVAYDFYMTLNQQLHAMTTASFQAKRDSVYRVFASDCILQWYKQESIRYVIELLETHCRIPREEIKSLLDPSHRGLHLFNELLVYRKVLAKPPSAEREELLKSTLLGKLIIAKPEEWKSIFDEWTFHTLSSAKADLILCICKALREKIGIDFTESMRAYLDIRFTRVSPPHVDLDLFYFSTNRYKQLQIIIVNNITNEYGNIRERMEQAESALTSPLSLCLPTEPNITVEMFNLEKILDNEVNPMFSAIMSMQPVNPFQPPEQSRLSMVNK